MKAIEPIIRDGETFQLCLGARIAPMPIAAISGKIISFSPITSDRNTIKSVRKVIIKSGTRLFLIRTFIYIYRPQTNCTLGLSFPMNYIFLKVCLQSVIPKYIHKKTVGKVPTVCHFCVINKLSKDILWLWISNSAKECIDILIIALSAISRISNNKYSTSMINTTIDF